MMNIDKKIKSIIIKHMPYPIPDSEINSETDLVDDLGFDSISFFAFLLDLEEEFEISFLCFEIETLILKNIVKMVENKLQNQ